MIYIVLLAALTLFLLFLRLVRTVDLVMEAAGNARQAWGVMQDRNMAEEAKEQLIQTSAIGMFKSFISILARGTFALLFGFSVIYIAILTDICSPEETKQALADWRVVLSALVAAPIIWKMTG